MSEHLKRPNEFGQISELKQRVDALERQMRRAAKDVGQAELTFTFPGAIYVAISPIKRVPTARKYRLAVIDLDVPGSSSSVLRIVKNDTQVGTDITVPANTGYMEVTVSLNLTARTDALQVNLVTAGAGAEGLTVDLWR